MIQGNNVRVLAKVAAALALLMLLLSLVTLLMLAPYSAPAADDFGYGAPVYYALRAGMGLPGALGAVIENVKYTYLNWQGTFSSVLLFSLQPGAFSDGLYTVTPIIMLGVIIAPVFLALGTLRTADKFGCLFLGSVVAFLSVQFLPSVADGVYWWNGAVHYLVFWFMAVLVVTLQIRLSRRGAGGPGFYVFAALTCAGAFFVGGGNYSTALVFALAAGCLTLYAWREKRGHLVVAANALIAMLALAGLVVSMVAPGNAVRQSGLTNVPALAAIGMSFQRAVADIVSMTDIKILGALLLCVPAFLFTVRKSGYRFPLPLLVLLFSFGAFAALYTPPIYAMGNSDVPRLNNMFWLAYLFLVFGNGFYLAGWVSLRVREAGTRRARQLQAAACIIGAVVFTAAVFVQVEKSNAYLAYTDIRSGVLQTYQRERAERLAVYNDKSILVPRFSPMSTYPNCFFKSKLLTWMSDLMVNGVPMDFPCYHACGGEVTFIPLDRANDVFSPHKRWQRSDFSKTFFIAGEDCVPMREFAGLAGFELGYDVQTDTIWMTTD